MQKILVTGALGQIGSELVPALRERYGSEAIVASGIRFRRVSSVTEGSIFEILDCTKIDEISAIVQKHNVGTIYHMAAIMSAVGEKKPEDAWDLNFGAFANILKVARQQRCAVFFPSSIGAFGPTTPSNNTPQDTLQRPTTIYGVAKVAGELLSDYYYARFDLDTSQSGFTWSGSTSLGSVVPDSTNNHTLSGHQDVSVFNGSYPLSSARIEGGVMNVSPNIAAYVSGPLGINLADIDVTNLSVSSRTLSTFNLSSGGGSFTVQVENTILSGNLTIDPLAGSTINENLAGTVTTSTVSGNLYKTSSGMHFSIPIIMNINASDPSSGISGSLSVNGNIVGDFDAPNPTIYCIAAPNSGSSFGGQIGYWGSTSVSNNDLTLIHLTKSVHVLAAVVLAVHDLVGEESELARRGGRARISH